MLRLITAKSQAGRILQLLELNGEAWTPAPQLSLISLQYCRALHTLRRAGYSIENRVVRCGRTVNGFYRLVLLASTASMMSAQSAQPTATSGQEPGLFSPAEMATTVRYQDPEEGR